MRISFRIGPKTLIKVLVTEVKPRLKYILIELCERLDIIIIEGAIWSDHVHLYVFVLPKHLPSKVMKVLKGKSAKNLRIEFLALDKQYWGIHTRARGYFVSAVGIDRDVIKAYVKKQIDFLCS